MKLDKFQKAKVVLGLSLFALLFAILFIPSIIDHGFGWASEDIVETLFLVLSFLAAIYVFWHYDYVVQKREQETFNLSSKLRSKEKELIETFQYLGKVNVHFSVIRDFLERIKKPIPTNKKELKEALRELLEIACSATGSEMAWLKIIDTKKRRILIEQKEGYNFEEEDKNKEVTVKNLLDIYSEGIDSKVNHNEIFYSKSDNPKD